MNSHLKAAEAFGITDLSPTAHVRREGEERTTAYCGKSIIGDVPTGERAWKNALGYHIGQHCIGCDKAYRAEHSGAVALTFDF